MSESVDYYEILQVHPNADADVIEKAYKTLIFKHHPDRGGSNEKCQQLNEAYAVLGNPAKRAAYDRTREASTEAGSSTPGETNGSARRDPGFETEEAAFATGAWPDTPEMHRVFHDVWVAYRKWLAADRPDTGSVYQSVRTTLASLAAYSFERLGPGESANDALSAIDRSFPALADTEALARASMYAAFERVPEPAGVQLPSELHRYHSAMRDGEQLITSDGRPMNPEPVLAGMLYVWLSYVAAWHPDQVSAYARACRSSFPAARDKTAFEKMLDALMAPDPVTALDAWAVWADGYYAAGQRYYSGHPVMRSVGVQVSRAVQSTVREVPKVAAGGCAGVASGIAVLVIGVFVLAAVAGSGDGGLMWSLCLLPVVVVGAVWALGRGFRGGYTAANEGVDPWASTRQTASQNASTHRRHPANPRQPGSSSGGWPCPHCGRDNARNRTICDWCLEPIRPASQSASAHRRQSANSRQRGGSHGGQPCPNCGRTNAPNSTACDWCWEPIP